MKSQLLVKHLMGLLKLILACSRIGKFLCLPLPASLKIIPFLLVNLLELAMDMARKRLTGEDAIRVLRQVEVAMASCLSILEDCCSAAANDTTYYKWRKIYGSMGPSIAKLN